MTKLELEAIRCLPEEYVADGTHVAMVRDKVVAMRNGSLPLIYDNDGWKVMEIRKDGENITIK